MKTVRVVAAVICSEDKIFATARGYGEFKGQWEFPGGKIEPGETPQEALVREIQEELDVKIEVGDLIDTIEYDYPSFHLSMDCFWFVTEVSCQIVYGDLDRVFHIEESIRKLKDAELEAALREDYAAAEDDTEE